MSEGRARHLFAGGNTALGFFSYYDNILSQEEAERIFILKGGPGTGKSTLMKRVAEEMLESGLEVEFYHCSSDSRSLDAVRIPMKRVAIIDGTAPHVVDPKTPGAVDRIINLGECWEESGIRAHRREILQINREIPMLFARSYKYLRSAAAVYEDSQEIHRRALGRGKMNQWAEQWIGENLGRFAVALAEGRERKLFASALTPGGYCNFLDSVLTGRHVLRISGGMGTGEELLLEKVRSAALERGLAVESFYCALNPHRLEHLLIPELNLAWTTDNRYHASTLHAETTLDMRMFLETDLLERSAADLEQNVQQFNCLMDIALGTIRRAKALHDELESYYSPYIRFEEIDQIRQKTLDTIHSL